MELHTDVCAAVQDSERPDGRSVLEVVDSGRPAQPGGTPASFAAGFSRGLLNCVGETVEVEHSIQVVVLVLEDPGQPPLRVDLERFPVDVGRLQNRLRGAVKRESLSRERETPFGLFILVGFSDLNRT